MVDDFQNNNWIIGLPTPHNDKFFIKVSPEDESSDNKILIKWGFGKTRTGSFVKDITSIMTEEEINEYK